MKAVYKKPSVRIEYFTLSQSIATCNAFQDSTVGGPGQGDKVVCGWDMGNVIVWTGEGESNCNMPWGEDDEFSGVCYNNPSGGNSIFGS